MLRRGVRLGALHLPNHPAALRMAPSLEAVRKEWVGQSKWDLDTPALVLDLPGVERNLKTMQEFAAKHGKGLRPHCKTHKCSELAKRQLEAGAIGVCVAKLGEAEVMVAAGVTKVLITTPVVTERKIQRLLTLMKKAPELAVCADHASNVRLLNELAKKAGQVIPVIIEFDAGQTRTGVPMEEAADLCRLCESLPSIDFLGVQRYPGHMQHIHGSEERKTKCGEVLQGAAAIVRQLREEGIKCPVLTGVGTGSYDTDVAVPELTDMQPGSYSVGDAEYQNIEKTEVDGALKWDHASVPMRLMGTVVSLSPLKDNHFSVDVGLKSMYKDGDRPKVTSPANSTFKYEWNGDEHGKVEFDPAKDSVPSLGDKVELVVSHCDPTINLHDFFYITDGEKVVDVWSIDCRGMGH